MRLRPLPFPADAAPDHCSINPRPPAIISIRFVPCSSPEGEYTSQSPSQKSNCRTSGGVGRTSSIAARGSLIPQIQPRLNANRANSRDRDPRTRGIRPRDHASAKSRAVRDQQADDRDEGGVPCDRKSDFGTTLREISRAQPQTIQTNKAGSIALIVPTLHAFHGRDLVIVK